METRRNGSGRRTGAGASARWDTESSLEELAQLVRTAGGVVVGQAVQKLRSPNPAHYVGPGKLGEIVAQRDATGYTMVVFDDELSPSQQRNLEQALKVKVLDRAALILDIFAMRAHTREGRLQVELAQSEYLLPRLAGQWSHLERLGSSGAQGAIGVRGPGETQLETDRRLARNKIGRLKREIEDVRRRRSLYRRRRARSGVSVVALVGYTNAGKSTLMRTLTHADVLVEDQLFATLDPVTRRLRLPRGRTTLLTDTVGFIQKLPTQLVAAFRATLEELAEADLLLHVVDITHPDAAQQSQTVDDTLADLGLTEQPRITALNKVDLFVGRDGGALTRIEELADYDLSLAQHRPDAVLISAERGWGLDELLARIEQALARAAEKNTPGTSRRDGWPSPTTAR
ncbi:MAG: GTPase HflX [Chloroflexi bacterium RBG_16_68_14]|nr:MAG: GTPase HflX [Chloroflexi bacterium RBG_16_68_14]